MKNLFKSLNINFTLFLMVSLSVYHSTRAQILISNQAFPTNEVQVCVNEALILKPTMDSAISYKWEINEGNGWTLLNNSKVLKKDFKKEQKYSIKLTSTSEDTILTQNLIVHAIPCCQQLNGASSSLQNIYYDDFGTLTDLSGSAFKVWDYISNPFFPKQIVVPATDPFRRKLQPDPSTSIYKGSGFILDGEYTVAAYMTASAPVNGIAGAMLYWSNNIRGLASITQPLGLDHSGNPSGAALLINNGPNSKGQTIYKKIITSLCPGNGQKVFVEFYIAVFTNEANGVDVTAILDGGGVVVSKNATAIGESYPNLTPGLGSATWVRIAAEVELAGDKLSLEIINNSDVYEHGNDLVIDDISIKTCIPASMELVFDTINFESEKVICKKSKLFLASSDNLRKYYDNKNSYIFQWSRTPEDVTSWKNIGGPTSSDSLVIEDIHVLIGNSVKDDKVYFRVVGGNDLIKTLDVFNINDYCRAYSVSNTIEATINCDVVTSLNLGNTSSKSFKIYPNPSNDFLHFEGDANEYIVYNSMGIQIMNVFASDLNIQSLDKGIYQVLVIDKKGNSYSQKLIKE